MINPFQDVEPGAQIRAIFYLDSQGLGWWQLVAEHGNTILPLRYAGGGPIRYPNGRQQLMLGMAAEHGYPVVIFDATGYVEELSCYNDAWG